MSLILSEIVTAEDLIASTSLCNPAMLEQSGERNSTRAHDLAKTAREARVDLLRRRAARHVDQISWAEISRETPHIIFDRGQ